MNRTGLVNPELAAIEVQGTTRSVFLVRSAIAAGAVYGLGSVSPFVNRALAQEGGGDVDILNFALTLEYLEATFYADALKKVDGLSSDVKKLATELRDNEDAHVDALMKTIKDGGGKPVEAPKVDFGGAFKNEKSFLELAQTFEDTGVSAYNGAAPQIESTEILAAAGSIVQVEAKHAGALRSRAGMDPAPAAFEPTQSREEVLKAVEPLLQVVP